jgi:hypothetical protein
MKIRSIGLDPILGLWVLLVGAAFIVPLVCRANVDFAELELMARYVYLGVVAVGLIGLAFRALRIVRR